MVALCFGEAVWCLKEIRMVDQMRMVFMRHGETDWNQEARIQGTIDIGLNDRGRQQVREACKLLEGTGFYTIIASPLERAAESARICSSILGVPVIEMGFLRERSFGKLEGLTISEIREQYGLEVEEILDDSPFVVESLEQVKSRVFLGLAELKRKYTGKNLLVVTHGSIIKWIMNELGREVGILGNAEFVVVE